MKENQSPIKKFSYLFIAVISIMLVLALLSLYWALISYGTNLGSSIVNIMLSVSAIVLAFYMLAQIRAKPMKLGFETPKVFTTIQCTKCDYKNTREFQKGDYVMKDAEQCPKCSSPTIISAVYKEVTEKED